MRPRALRPLHVLLCAPAAALVAASLTPITHARADLTAPRPVVVAIDAGHGGKPDNRHPEVQWDPGAVASGGLQESDVTLDVARRVRSLLQRDSVSVVMTRDADVFEEITPRMDKAIAAGADVFVSIHMDGNHDAGVAGTWVLYHRDADLAFAKTMLSSLAAALRPYDVQADGVLSKPEMWVRATMPTVTVEPLFLTNSREADLARRSEVRDAIASAIRDAVVLQDPVIRTRAVELAAWRTSREAASNTSGPSAGGKRGLLITLIAAGVIVPLAWWRRRPLYRIALVASKAVVILIARLDGEELPELLVHPERRQRIERRRALLARHRRAAHRASLYDQIRS
jgi:N-acetylmuramoyl-L-alanine amidase